MKTLHLAIIGGIGIVVIGAILILSIQNNASTTRNTQVSYSASECNAKIAQQENQTVALDLEQKAVWFIENKAMEFKSLNQKYLANWVSTNYQWNADQSTCTATLKGITVDFELSNSTAPFVGMAYITVDPSVSKVIDIKTDILTILVPPNCTDRACRVAHGIFN